MRVQGLERGKKDGGKQANLQTGQHLLALGTLTENQIATGTGLSLDEINRLRQDGD
ncbi:hypothetical protein [Thiorhodovibrio frisius]|uniref:hypothetical protein n=1 Tax=Thiorhodovibrio frisius TaxID=631362 RepID=UPI000255E1B0|nr:hypothetical protein [Thiorhodovibrio frisius]